jgi:uncharacterized protein (DUF1800 family)
MDMPVTERSLVAHLMRRAGFGASAGEIDALAARRYEDLVEDLVNPEQASAFEDDLLRRYYLELNNADSHVPWQGYWIYRMVNTPRPLEEKIALFWHHIFATSIGKSEHTPSSRQQIDTFRRVGLSDLRTIYLELARDPAMLFWLDNCENHRGEPNENWGRELLELFSMGVGNYTEQDIKMASRAFTGWTFTQPLPLDPYGRYSSQFLYVADDHDDGEKTFLGRTGRFNGEDIIDIIVEQPATHRFIARHMYNFFVADEPQVPAWGIVPPRDPAAVEMLAGVLQKTRGDIRATLRVLFNSDVFKNARGQRVKGPVELVVGTVKLAGTHRFPEPGLNDLATAVSVMGQALMTPPTVEGWHTGAEWIDAGTLNERVNFAVNQLTDACKPGLQALCDRLADRGRPLPPEEFVDICIDQMGPLTVSAETWRGLVEHAAADGNLVLTGPQREQAQARVARMAQAIVSSIEYQFA